jgi:hypothetical protein
LKNLTSSPRKKQLEVSMEDFEIEFILEAIEEIQDNLTRSHLINA